MLNFSKFITEAKTAAETTANRTHLEPPGFRALDGHDDVGKADFHLREFHNHLLGKKSKVRVTTKYDGTPAIHAGIDEDGNHQFAFKGMFNKNPKIFKTEDDVDREYPTDHPLNHIMKQAMRHIPGTLPKTMKPGEWMKGDVLSVAGSDRSPKRENGFISTHPNVMKYKFPEDSQEGKELADSQMGIVWHTKFDKNGKASSISPKDRAAFSRKKEVFSLDPEVKPNAANYSPEKQNEFLNHMENARQEYAKIKPDTYDRLAGHNETLRNYLNNTFRTDEEPSFEGYVQHMSNRQKKDVDSVKTPAAKERKTQAHAAFMQQAHENRKDVERLLNLHNHLDKAKNVLVSAADLNSASANELPNGEATSGEGYVTDDGKGDAMKHVHKDVRKALLTGAGFIGKAKAKTPIAESVQEAGNGKKVMSFIRANPVHEGHGEVVRAGQQEAKRIGGSHEVILSHSQDAKKNPLTPEQKLKHARRAFPGVNFSVSSPAQPTLLHHLAKAHAEGHREVSIVGGSDRDTMGELAKKYNGVKGPHGYYNLKLNFVQAGAERKEAGSGVEGYSASKMRDAVKRKDVPAFKSMAPKSMSDRHKTDMYNDVRKGMNLNESLMNMFTDIIKNKKAQNGTV